MISKINRSRDYNRRGLPQLLEPLTDITNVTKLTEP